MVKPGDTCLVLPAGPGDPNAWWTVVAIRPASEKEVADALQSGGVEEPPFWLVDTRLTWGYETWPEKVPYCPERYLIPIRDPDADVSETQDRTVTA